MSKTNSVSVELVTTLTIHILLDVFRNDNIAKGVLIGGTHVEPRSVPCS